MPTEPFSFERAERAQRPFSFEEAERAADPFRVPSREEVRAEWEAKKDRKFFSETLPAIKEGATQQIGHMAQVGVDALKEASDPSNLPKLPSTVAESFARGGFDLGNVARMAGVATWDRAANAVDAFRQSVFGSLTPEEVDEREFERYYQRKIHNLGYAEAREKGLEGDGYVAPGVSDLPDELQPAKNLAEAGSYVLDPTAYWTVGGTAGMKAAGKAVSRAAAKASAKMTGKQLAKGAAEVAEEVFDPSALVKPSTGPVRQAAQTTAEKVRATGEAVKDVSKRGTDAVEEVTKNVLGDNAVQKAAAAPLESFPVAGQKVGVVAENLGAAGREVLAARSGGRYSIFDQVSKSTTAPMWLRGVARAAVKTGFDKALVAGKTMAKGVAADSARGAAVGGILGGLVAESPEEFGGALGTGAAIGGGFGTLRYPLLKGARRRSAENQDLAQWFFEKPADQQAVVADMNLTRNQALQMATMEHLAKGIVNEGGNVEFRYLPGEQFRRQFGDERGAFVADPDTAPVVYLNGDHASSRTLFHEAFHALSTSSDIVDFGYLRRILFDVADGEGNVLSKGLLNAADLEALTDRYASRLGDEARSQFNQMDSEQRTSYMLQEIGAELFAGLVEGSPTDFLQDARSVKRQVLDSLIVPQAMKRLSTLRRTAEKLGFDLNETRGTQSDIFGKQLQTTPEIEVLMRNIVREADKLRKNIEFDDDVGSAGFTLKPRETQVAGNEALVSLFKDNDNFARNPDGTIRMQGGRPVLLTEAEIRKLHRTRAEDMKNAIRRVGDDGDPKSVREIDGNFTGRYFSDEQMVAIQNLADDILTPSMKAKLKFINDAAKAGDGQPLALWYNAALGKSKKYSSAISESFRMAIPIAMDITKAGNFLVKTLDLTHFDAKLNRWMKRRPKAFDDFEGTTIAEKRDNFLRDVGTYLDNHLSGRRGETGLAADEATSIRKKNRINDFFNFNTKETDILNPSRLSKPGGKDLLIRSRRFDRINRAELGSGDLFPVDYELIKINFQPGRNTRVDISDGVSTKFSPRKLTEAERQSNKISKDERPPNSNPPSRFRIDSGPGGLRMHRALRWTHRDHRFGAAVEVKDASFYASGRNALYLGDDGLAGAAVTQNGDLVSVFRHPESTSSAREILRDASKLSSTLDAFDIGGFLPDKYKTFGFKPAARVRWNDAYAPPGWPYEIAGRPDIVLMFRDPVNKFPKKFPKDVDYAQIRDKIPIFDDWDEAAAIQQKWKQKVKDAGGYPDYTRFSPKADDASYRRAVESGDMETAQMMVDEAAKAAGYDVGPVHHGTDASFNAFEVGRTGYRGMLLSSTETKSNGMFFSQSVDDAGEYGANVRPFHLDTGRVLKSPDEIPLSSRSSAREKATAKKAWDDAEAILEPAIYEEGGVRYIDTDNGVSRTIVDADGDWVAKVFSDGLLDWSLLDNPEVVRRMKERGYDSVKVYEPQDASEMSWFVTRPEQIKSAEPVVYDDAGNVVPLSKRFDQSTADVRFSPRSEIDALKEKSYKLLSEAEKKNVRRRERLGRNKQRVVDRRKQVQARVEETRQAAEAEETNPLLRNVPRNEDGTVDFKSLPVEQVDAIFRAEQARLDATKAEQDLADFSGIRYPPHDLFERMVELEDLKDAVDRQLNSQELDPTQWEELLTISRDLNEAIGEIRSERSEYGRSVKFSPKAGVVRTKQDFMNGAPKEGKFEDRKHPQNDLVINLPDGTTTHSRAQPSRDSVTQPSAAIPRHLRFKNLAEMEEFVQRGADVIHSTEGVLYKPGEPFFYEQMYLAARDLAGGDLNKADLYLRLLAYMSPRTEVSANFTKSFGSGIAPFVAEYAVGNKGGSFKQTQAMSRIITEWKSGEPFGTHVPGVDNKVENFYLNPMAELIKAADVDGSRLPDSVGYDPRFADRTYLTRMSTNDMWHMAAFSDIAKGDGNVWPGFVLPARGDSIGFKWTDPKYGKRVSLNSPEGRRVMEYLSKKGEFGDPKNGKAGYSIDDLSSQEKAALKLRDDGTIEVFSKQTEAGLNAKGVGPLYDHVQMLTGMIADRVNESGGYMGKLLDAYNVQELLWAEVKQRNPLASVRDFESFLAPMKQVLDYAKTGMKGEMPKSLEATTRSFDRYAKRLVSGEVDTGKISEWAKALEAQRDRLKKLGDPDPDGSLTAEIAERALEWVNQYAVENGYDIQVDRVSTDIGAYLYEGEVYSNWAAYFEGRGGDFEKLDLMWRGGAAQEGGNYVRPLKVEEKILVDAFKAGEDVAIPNQLNKDLAQVIEIGGAGNLTTDQVRSLVADLAKFKDERGNSFLSGLSKVGDKLIIHEGFYRGEWGPNGFERFDYSGPEGDWFSSNVDRNLNDIKNVLENYGLTVTSRGAKVVKSQSNPFLKNNEKDTVIGKKTDRGGARQAGRAGSRGSGVQRAAEAGRDLQAARRFRSFLVDAGAAAQPRQQKRIVVDADQVREMGRRVSQGFQTSKPSGSGFDTARQAASEAAVMTTPENAQLAPTLQVSPNDAVRLFDGLMALADKDPQKLLLRFPVEILDPELPYIKAQLGKGATRLGKRLIAARKDQLKKVAEARKRAESGKAGPAALRNRLKNWEATKAEWASTIDRLVDQRLITPAKGDMLKSRFADETVD